MKPTPVVNRPLREVERAEARAAQLAKHRKPVKKRLREIVGGAGLVMVFEEPERAPGKRSTTRGRRVHKDPLVEEAKAVTRKRLRKEYARRLLGIMFKHLARYESMERSRLPRVPGLRGKEWTRDKSETFLLDALLSELTTECRLHNVLRIHTELCRKRLVRERTELVDSFFTDEANSKTVLKWYRLNEKS